MKNKIFRKLNLLMLSTLLLSLAACNESEFLNLRNPNASTEDVFWLSEKNAYSAIASVYAPLRRQMEGVYGAYTGYQTQNVRADDTWTIVGEEHGTWVLSTFTNTPDQGFYDFGALYTAINRANVFISKIGQTEMDEGKKKQWIGEVKFLRAYNYFLLVRDWGQVPLRTVSASENSEEAMKGTSPISDIWALIEQDLKEAKEHLPVDRPESELGRITKGAAIAMLGKAYNYQKKYTEAETELSLLMQSPYKYDLVDNPDDNFTEFAEMNKESVFELVYDGAYGGQGTWWHEDGGNTLGIVLQQFYSPEGTGGWFKIMPSAALIDAFMVEERPEGSNTRFDKRLYTSCYLKPSDFNDSKADETWYGGMTFDDMWEACATKRAKGEPDFPVIDGVKGRFLMKKFTNFFLDWPQANNMDSSPAHRNNNLRLMRFAEVLLLHAEACIKNGNLVEATKSINRIRQRAGLPTKTWANADELWDEMVHQKFLELFFECERWYDLKRWYSYEEVKAILEKNKKQGATNFQSKHIYLPIPQGEVNTNTALEQNPDWR